MSNTPGSRPLEAPELTVVIPAFNEEATIETVAEGHLAAAAELGISCEVVILDDGSTDRTGEILGRLAASQPALMVLSHASRLGVGRTVLDLYAASRGAWTYLVAGDDQVPSTELRKLWAAREGCDLVVGRRRPRRDPALRIAMGWIYSFAIRSLFRVRVHDIDSVKLYRTETLRSVWPHAASAFEEAEILIGLTRRCRCVREVDIAHRARQAGRAHGSDPRLVMRVVYDMARFIVKELAKER